MTAARRNLRVVRNPAGRPPPNDLELEAYVLGAVLYLGAYEDARRTRRSAFYSDPHRVIWDAIETVAKRGDDPTFVLVSAQLRAEERLNRDVAEALERASKGAQLDVSVAEAAALTSLRGVRREFIAACQRAAAEGYGPLSDDSEWLDEQLRTLEQIAARGKRIAGRELAALLGAELAEAEGVSLKRASGAEITTGFGELDKLSAGLHEGETTLLSGKTGLGKSAFAGCLALNAAWGGNGVAWLQLEPTRVVLRLAIAQGRIDAQALRANTLGEQGMTALKIAADQIRDLPIVVHDARRPSIAQAEAILSTMCRRAREMSPSGRVLAVVDYLQLVNGKADVGDRANREEAVAEVGRRLVEFAEKERVGLLALCQTNGEGEIRESRAVLQHAHNWWALHCDKPSGDEPGPFAANVEVRKQRHGPWPRRAAMWFYPKSVLFSDGGSR